MEESSKVQEDASAKKRKQPPQECSGSTSDDNNTAANNNNDATQLSKDGAENFVLPPQHSMYGGSIAAACEAVNATRTKRHRTDEEKRAERLAANRRSARESRNRKKIIFNKLQKAVSRLADENTQLREENATLKKEMEDLKQKFRTENDQKSKTASPLPRGDVSVPFHAAHSSTDSPPLASVGATQGAAGEVTSRNIQDTSVFNSSGLTRGQRVSSPQATSLNPNASATQPESVISSGPSVGQGDSQPIQPQAAQDDSFRNMTLEQIALLATTQQQPHIPAVAAMQNQGIPSGLFNAHQLGGQQGVLPLNSFSSGSAQLPTTHGAEGNRNTGQQLLLQMMLMQQQQGAMNQGGPNSRMH